MKRSTAYNHIQRAIGLLLDDAAKNGHVSHARCVDESNVTIHHTPAGKYSVLDLDHNEKHDGLSKAEAQRIAANLVTENW